MFEPPTVRQEQNPVMNSETEACLVTKGLFQFATSQIYQIKKNDLASHLAAARALTTAYNNSLIKTAAEHFLWGRHKQSKRRYRIPVTAPSHAICEINTRNVLQSVSAVLTKPVMNKNSEKRIHELKGQKVALQLISC